MKDYKECSTDEFTQAINSKDMSVKELSDEYLYILYTKFSADASTCFSYSTGYSASIGRRSKTRSDNYKAELLRRGINLGKK